MQTVRVAPVELDLQTAPAFVAQLRRSIDRAGEGPVTVDCEQISFMDSSAYYALLDVTRYAGASGHRLVVGSVRTVPAWVLAFCDWDHHLTIERLVDSSS
ncbi:MAG: STAS domain-containing protein [Acidimicrobiia bacterium]